MRIGDADSAAAAPADWRKRRRDVGIEAFPVVLNHMTHHRGLGPAIHPGMDPRVKPAGDE
jgi:hypothetical protein